MKIKLRPAALKNGSKSPTTATRKALAAKGQALPGGGFPTPNADFLRRAIQSIGRTPPEKRPALVAYLRKRAKQIPGGEKYLAKGALAMSNEEYVALLELAGDLASEGNGGTSASGANITTSTNSASDGPRVSGQSGSAKLATYKKLRKKGMSHKQALAFAKNRKSAAPKA